MNSVVLVLFAACFFVLAYRIYGSFLAERVLRTNDQRPTPAVTQSDGRDFVKTNRFVLFGHHFAAIAAAGPLIGPVLAAQYGVVPGVLWILLGAVLAGAVHDFVILFASVRRGGNSLVRIARDETGPVTGAIASVAVLLILLLSMAVLAIVVVGALAESAWGTFTVLATVPLALIMGLWMYKIRPGKVGEASAIGVVGLVAATLAGPYLSQWGLAAYFTHSREVLAVALPVYGFVAATLPVWMLLCPRDYLSTWVKLGVILMLAGGIVLVGPTLRMPPFTSFVSGGGPVVPGPLFPYLFITIACGAVSGFHSLIASGTTPKMIPDEGAMKFIGYGAMVTEGFVAITALVAACALHPGDYFAMNSEAVSVAVKSMKGNLDMNAINALVQAKTGYLPVEITRLSQEVEEQLVGRTGGGVALAVGMASIFGKIPGLTGLLKYWYHFVIVFEALFILTAVDTGTRVARYLMQEILGKVYRPLGENGNRFGVALASFLVVGAWGWLVYNGSIMSLWPMFGVANQLLAVVALAVGTTVLLKMGRVRYVWTTAVPMVLLVVTTVTAGLMNIFAPWGFLSDRFIRKYGVAFAYIDVGLTVLLLGCVIGILVTSALRWRELLRTGGAEEPEASLPDGAVPIVG
ncbi:MAG: carbon starvation protein A [Capsulimonadales bacterium]|nr:carbon starvation protein A [Capsulimonadales bacterium]